MTKVIIAGKVGDFVGWVTIRPTSWLTGEGRVKVILKKVKNELKQRYGSRLVEVRLFGSQALIQVIFTNKKRLKESGSPLYVGVRKESLVV